MERTEKKEPAALDEDSLLKRLGPGLITGASDDDPSGIGTYSQAGAQLRFGISWTMTYPLMVAIQEISGRIGRITGHGIAGNVCRNYSTPVIWSLVVLLFVANTINVAADLGAMADASRLLMGGWSPLYVVAYAVVSVAAQVFVSFKRYVAVLKWLTLVLFAYVIALAIVHVPWDEALRGLVQRHLSDDLDRHSRHDHFSLPVHLAVLAGSRRTAYRSQQASAQGRERIAVA